jgi:thioesterase domain-containing protein
VNDAAERAIGSDRKMVDARLVELRPGRSGPCIFLVPGLGGRVEGFSEFATLLDTEMPLFAIEARGVDALSDPDHDMATMVEHYIDRIRTIQASGPYFLIGHSFGGAIVFEMAHRILAMRERVGCLILLDTPLPKRNWTLRFFLVNLVPRIRGHLERIVGDSLSQSINYYTRRLRRRWQGLHNIPQDLMFGPEAARMLMATDMLMSQWRPDFYPGRLILFCCTDTELWTLYERLAAELETHVVAADHINMVNQPHVPVLAREVSACLEKASSPSIRTPDVPPKSGEK